MNYSKLYYHDFYSWTLKMTEALKSRNFENIDFEHLAEEMELMSSRDRQELKNRLAILIMHLLKWQFQPQFQSTSWQKTIKVQRNDIKDNLEDSPSLNHYLPELLLRAYKKAIIQASAETGLSEKTFPESAPYTLEQLLDDTFYPQSQV